MKVHLKYLLKELIDGKIDGFVCTDITLPNILESIEFEYSDVNPSFAVMSSDFYIAFSKNTPASTVNIWKTTLEEIKSDGTYEEIFRKWFPQQLNMFL
jgi:polar amino acid transport system substrate-binding protein